MEVPLQLGNSFAFTAVRKESRSFPSRRSQLD